MGSNIRLTWRHCSAAVLALSVVGTATNVVAKPEYFVESMKYGATDCLFCHVSAAGGPGLNERGQWLQDQLSERNVDVVDVSWLKEREDLKETAVSLEESTSDVASQTDATETVAIPLDTKKRPFDYSTSFGEWPAYGGDDGASKYSPMNQITRDNLDQLKIAWIWESEHDSGSKSNPRQAADSFKGTPLMAGGRIFIRDRYSAVTAINPATGETLWMYDPGSKQGPRPTMFGFTTRGLAYHRDDKSERVFLLTSRGWLIALDATTGELIEQFGDKGKVDLTEGLRRPLDRNQISWSNPPNVCGDVVVIGSQTNDGSHGMGRRRGRGQQSPLNMPVGDVRGFDVYTGKQTWAFETIPQEGEFGHDTWGNESWKWMGNTNVWSTTSCDAELGHAYLPVTAPTNHLYGASRPGNNLFSTSTVAVDNKTGERVWHFQIVHHDIWDYDLPAAPTVADIVFEGKPRKVVAQVTKVGYLFVFDRETGQPLWEVEEVKVPVSSLEGEVASPTQPRPTWPRPYARQGMTEDDLLDLTPELERQAKAQFQNVKFGAMYSSASEEGTFISPGVGGGANWGGAAFDKVERTLFLGTREMPMILRARRIPDFREESGYTYATWFETPNVAGLPPVKPPWSKIVAYDLDTGNVLWEVPNGAGPKRHPALRGLDLPDLGAIGPSPGLLVTPAAVFLGHNGNVAGELRALDKDSGKLIWQGALRGWVADAPPMTYLVHGKQYIVIGTGASPQPTRLVAFSL